jgi:hypothetical protein
MSFFPNPRKVHTTPGEILEITFYYNEQLKLLEGRIMVEKILTKKPAVTIARMTKIKKKNNPIIIPMDFIEYFKPEDEEKRWAVMILHPATKIIRIIHTKSPVVIKISIKWTQIDPDTFQELGAVFIRNKIKTIQSSGFCVEDLSLPCPDERPCPYPYTEEVYIDSSNLLISNDQLRSELLTITNVTNVELTQCSL